MLRVGLGCKKRKGHLSQMCRQSMFPNKSLLLSAQTHPNNIYLMACRSTPGVGLLRGTQKHGHHYNLEWYTEVVGLTRRKKHGSQRLSKHINTDTWFIRTEQLPPYLDQQWKGAFSPLYQLVQLIFGAVSVQRKNLSLVWLHRRHTAHAWKLFFNDARASGFKNKSVVQSS